MTDEKPMDHVAEALGLRNLASSPDYPSQHANLLAAAQVHATLALVEQQKRTADELHTANTMTYNRAVGLHD